MSLFIDNSGQIFYIVLFFSFSLLIFLNKPENIASKIMFDIEYAYLNYLNYFLISTVSTAVYRDSLPMERIITVWTSR